MSAPAVIDCAALRDRFIVKIFPPRGVDSRGDLLPGLTIGNRKTRIVPVPARHIRFRLYEELFSNATSSIPVVSLPRVLATGVPRSELPFQCMSMPDGKADQKPGSRRSGLSRGTGVANQKHWGKPSGDRLDWRIARIDHVADPDIIEQHDQREHAIDGIRFQARLPLEEAQFPDLRPVVGLPGAMHRDRRWRTRRSVEGSKGFIPPLHRLLGSSHRFEALYLAGDRSGARRRVPWLSSREDRVETGVFRTVALVEVPARRPTRKGGAMLTRSRIDSGMTSGDRAVMGMTRGKRVGTRYLKGTWNRSGPGGWVATEIDQIS